MIFNKNGTCRKDTVGLKHDKEILQNNIRNRIWKLAMIFIINLSFRFDKFSSSMKTFQVMNVFTGVLNSQVVIIGRFHYILMKTKYVKRLYKKQKQTFERILKNEFFAIWFLKYACFCRAGKQ